MMRLRSDINSCSRGKVTRWKQIGVVRGVSQHRASANVQSSKACKRQGQDAVRIYSHRMYGEMCCADELCQHPPRSSQPATAAATCAIACYCCCAVPLTSAVLLLLRLLKKSGQKERSCSWTES
jgi:hypothetical protein